MNHKQRSSLFAHPTLGALRRPVVRIGQRQGLNTVRAALPGTDVAPLLEAERAGSVLSHVTDETSA